MKLKFAIEIKIESELVSYSSSSSEYVLMLRSSKVFCFFNNDRASGQLFPIFIWSLIFLDAANYWIA